MAGLHQLTLRVPEDVYQKMLYWSEKKEQSLSEYLMSALALKIRWDNQDYDLPPLEIQRLNQLIEVVTGLSENQRSLEGVIISRFDSLLNLTMGDNYLLDGSDDDSDDEDA